MLHQSGIKKRYNAPQIRISALEDAEPLKVASENVKYVRREMMEAYGISQEIKNQTFAESVSPTSGSIFKILESRI